MASPSSEAMGVTRILRAIFTASAPLASSASAALHRVPPESTMSSIRMQQLPSSSHQ